MHIFNLTQHYATPEQVEAGVIEPRGDIRTAINELLNFDTIPTKLELEERAEALSTIAAMYDVFEESDSDFELFPDAVMLGGAPYFMSTLERWCIAQGLTVLYAFSKRESVERSMEDGSVIKEGVFKHKGFVTIEN